MNYITVFLALVFTSLVSLHCTGPKKTAEPSIYRDSQNTSGGQELTIHLETGKAFNHPTYVIWMEDMYGNYLQTLFITQSYASGIFGHEMVGDTLWMPVPGASFQPAALPYWTHKKGPIQGQNIVPTPEHPFVDAYTGATPLGNLDFTTRTGQKPPFRILCEVNQPWDWDKYWTNNKYPDSPAYKHSAQPSVIYATTIDTDNTVFHLNPIGHGDPKGETGKLFTNLNTLSSAKEIFKSIHITLENDR
jgi:hypothetical protein